jgi:hypothetical protein
MGSKGLKVVSISGSSGKLFVSQEDLFEELALWQAYKDAAKAYYGKTGEIRRAIQAGAKVEPGALKAKIRHILVVNATPD